MRRDIEAEIKKCLSLKECIVGESAAKRKHCISCYSRALWTTIFGPRIHFPTRSFWFKYKWLAKHRVVAESINTQVSHRNEPFSQEMGGCIREPKMHLVEIVTVGNQSWNNLRLVSSGTKGYTIHECHEDPVSRGPGFLYFDWPVCTSMVTVRL